MSRTLTAGMQAHLAQRGHTIARMLRLDLPDTDTFAFTDHDKPISFDLGDGSVEYQPWTGIDLSAATLVTGLEASNFEVTGPLTDLVTRTAVLGGRFHGAAARLFAVNWADLTDGSIAFMKGKVAEARVDGSRFVLEVRGLTAPFNETWGRVLTPLCTHAFGDEKCGVARTPIAATVSAVANDYQFTLNIGGTYADDYFNSGTVEFLTGNLANTAEATVVDYTGSSGAVQLLEPLVDSPEIGDTVNIYRGCSKLLKSENATLPTCLDYDNVINFGGFPEVPGTRNYIKVSAPGATYE